MKRKVPIEIEKIFQSTVDFKFFQSLFFPLETASSNEVKINSKYNKSVRGSGILVRFKIR